MQTLRRGSAGAEVTAWQTFLRGQNLYMAEITGTFDEPTEEASKSFQVGHGLTADGVVGSQTIAKAMIEGFVVDPPSDTDTDKSGPNWPPMPVGVTPTSLALREQLFGKFQYEPAPTPGNPEGIKILGNWVQENITQVRIPQLAGVVGAPGSEIVSFHKAVAPQLAAMFQGWEDAGLLPLVKTFAGTWAPRYIRGSRTTLSNHAFGTAIDLNAGWNPLGARPALVGQTGSTRELVEIAVKNGFFWGGWFGCNGGRSDGGRSDGMHFEIFRIV